MSTFYFSNVDRDSYFDCFIIKQNFSKIEFVYKKDRTFCVNYNFDKFLERYHHSNCDKSNISKFQIIIYCDRNREFYD